MQEGPDIDMDSYFDISNDLKDVWDADIDPVSWPSYQFSAAYHAQADCFFIRKIRERTKQVPTYLPTNRLISHKIKSKFDKVCGDNRNR